MASQEKIVDKDGNKLTRVFVPFKLKVGRPSSYDPKNCDEVLRLGAEGASIAQIAVHFNVDRQTVYDWGKKYPDFAAALRRAFDLSQSWWELYGRHAGIIPSFNATVWKKTMECRFRGDYTESKEMVISGPDGLPVEMTAQNNALNIELLHPEDRETLKQLLLAAQEGAAEENEE